ncbi:MAG: hypothetical protein GC153_07515 [Alphaproteobacteria bacterium]|nr:hypothetical protein [Alphaproteobacteria bacterium]
MIFPADDLCPDDPRPTALYAAAAGAASANSWTSVNGWSVARVYTSLDEEYEAAQNAAGVVDAGPVVRYSVSGAGAAAFLARATTTPVAGLEPGESARGLMLDEDGMVVDIVETTRLGESLYLLSASRPHARRLQLAARGLDAIVDDITSRIAALALIGPEARDVASAAGLDASSDHLAAQGRVRGVETSVRPIHFGALSGVEIIFPHEEALTLWERIRRARAPQPVGLAALEIFRIEGGAPRPGADFVPADEAREKDERRSPAEIGLDHLAPTNSAWFNGRRALKTQARPARALVALSIDAESAAPGAAVFARKGPAGRLTSAAFSPRLKRIVAFADLAVAALGGPLEVALGGGDSRAAARVIETPESRLAAAFRAGAAPRP